MNILRYVQVAVVHGGVGRCGDADFPGIYVRLDAPEILSFVASVMEGDEKESKRHF